MVRGDHRARGYGDSDGLLRAMEMATRGQGSLSDLAAKGDFDHQWSEEARELAGEEGTDEQRRLAS